MIQSGSYVAIRSIGVFQMKQMETSTVRNMGNIQNKEYAIFQSLKPQNVKLFNIIPNPYAIEHILIKVILCYSAITSVEQQYVYWYAFQMPAQVRKKPTDSITKLVEKNTRIVPTNVKNKASRREFFLPNFYVKKEKLANPITAPINTQDCTITNQPLLQHLKLPSQSANVLKGARVVTQLLRSLQLSLQTYSVHLSPVRLGHVYATWLSRQGATKMSEASRILMRVRMTPMMS